MNAIYEQIDGRNLRFTGARDGTLKVNESDTPKPAPEPIKESTPGIPVKVRPGTWVIRKEGDYRMPNDIRNDFRDKFSGCSFGCSDSKLRGFSSIGIQEAADISRGYPAFAQAITDEMNNHHHNLQELIRRVEHISHKYHIRAEEYMNTLRECLDFDIFKSLTNEMILRDITLFNEKYL